MSVFGAPLCGFVCRGLHHMQRRGLQRAGGPHCEWQGVSEMGPAIPSSAHLQAGKVLTFISPCYTQHGQNNNNNNTFATAFKCL